MEDPGNTHLVGWFEDELGKVKHLSVHSAWSLSDSFLFISLPFHLQGKRCFPIGVLWGQLYLIWRTGLGTCGCLSLRHLCWVTWGWWTWRKQWVVQKVIRAVVWSVQAACPVSVLPGTLLKPDPLSNRRGRGPRSQPQRCCVCFSQHWISCDVASWTCDFSLISAAIRLGWRTLDDGGQDCLLSLRWVTVFDMKDYKERRCFWC